MKIAIIGSRTFEDYQLLCDIMERFQDEDITIVSGGAKGADTLGNRTQETNIDIPTRLQDLWQSCTSYSK